MRENKRSSQSAVEKLFGKTYVERRYFIYLRSMKHGIPAFYSSLRNVKNRFGTRSVAMVLAIAGLILMGSQPITSKVYIDGQYIGEDTIAEMHISRANALQFEVDLNPEIAYKDYAVRGGLVYDVTRNKIVWGKNMDQAVPIASITKMMVALIAVEEITADKICWDEPIEVTREAVLIQGSKVYLKQGETLTMRKLLEAAMIRSGNDACYLIAQYLGDTEAEFVERMNRKAEALGMENTKFSNSTGMPADKGKKDNHSTPMDLLRLAKEVLKYPDLVEITSRKRETIDNGYNPTFTFDNRNKLVSKYEDDIDGLKTGFTNNAKYCIVATSKRCDYRVISIVLGVENSYLRNQIVVGMLNNYYDRIGLGVLGEKLPEDFAKNDEENEE